MDWKWMIERGGRVTFTVISAPPPSHSLPPHPHPHPFPALLLLLLLQTRRRIQWHWKLALYWGFFGADRIRAISLNLAVKETHLAEINSGGVFFVLFSCLFAFLCRPSYSTSWVSEGVVLFPWIWWKRHWREHLLTAPPKVCGRRTKSDTQQYSKKSQMGLAWKISMLAKFPRKYSQGFLISCV